jgi:hypothetical protein
LFTGSKARFAFLATGTGPLAQQWRKDGADLVDETNQTLMLNSVMLSDAGGYDVVVTNIAGSATSQVATLTVTLRPPPPTQLKVDLNNSGADDSPANTETGFLSFSILAAGTGPFTHTLAGADVTLTAIGTTMESRKRTTPVNNGAFTEEKLLQDFVFTRDAANDQGLDVAVEFLESNRVYEVSIWSFDSGSGGNNRISDWTANGMPVQNGWSFIGTTPPVDNNTYRFNFDTVSDAGGKILIKGRRNAGAAGTLNVFMNALQITRRELRVLTIEHNSFGETLLTIETIDPNVPHRFEQKAALDQNWSPVPDGDVFFSNINGRVLSVTISPNGAPIRFLRVVEGP